MDYCINLGCWGEIFAVPAAVVDRYLKMAGRLQLQVLLYMLRNSGKKLQSSDIERAVGQSGEAVEEALCFWQEAGILACKNGAVTAADAAPAEPCERPETPGESDTAAPAAQAEAEKSLGESGLAAQGVRLLKREHIRYDYRECSRILSTSDSVRNMLVTVEGLLAKQLNNTDICVFVTLSEWYGLPCEVIPMLVQYCKSVGKSRVSYIEATGIGWSEEEIDTLEKAEQKIKRMGEKRAAWIKISTMLELEERKPTQKEEDYCTLWLLEQRQPDELIHAAYARCIDKKGKLSFSYMNGILSRWHKSGLKTLEGVLASEGSRASGKGAESGRFEPTYDRDEIEKMLDEEMLETDDTGEEDPNGKG